jgi:hypothetical protein
MLLKEAKQVQGCMLLRGDNCSIQSAAAGPRANTIEVLSLDHVDFDDDIITL